MNIKEMFDKFSSANYFSRIDNNHPLELFVGLDEKRRKAIELRSPFVPRKITGTVAIEINQYKKPEYNTIRFSLVEEDISGLFFMFCDDLIEQTRNINKNQGYSAIINRYIQWKRMFVTSKKLLLTESEIMGLIGELLYMGRTLANSIGLFNALKSWSGQELTHKDFSYNNSWTEVKTIHSGGITVKISSLEQLESENEGELAVYTLEKMSTAYNGITLNKLVVETRNLFPVGEERDEFMTKVSLQGYEYNDAYDDYVYEISSFNRYNVSETFPKITSRNIAPAIKKVTYDIALTDIDEFRIK